MGTNDLSARLLELEQLHAELRKAVDDRAAHELESHVQVRGAPPLTVQEWGERWLTRREREGVRSVADHDRPIWRLHVPSSLLLKRLCDVTRDDARVWWTDLHTKTVLVGRFRQPTSRLLSAPRLRNIKTVVAGAFRDAVEDGLLDRNPFERLRVHRSRRATSSLVIERVLRPWEQEKALAVIPYPQRWIAEIALGSGVRKGELTSLRIVDVTVDGPAPCIAIRYSGRRKRAAATKPPKGNRARRVPLFGMALAAMRSWLAHLETTKPTNPLGLVFPGRNGHERNAAARVFPEMRQISKAIGRRFCWHDWRHTCATSLLLGWWEQKSWTLEAVAVFLGHLRTQQTERYARLAEELAFDAAARSSDVASPAAVADLVGGRDGDGDAVLGGPDGANTEFCVGDVRRNKRGPGLRKSREGVTRTMGNQEGPLATLPMRVIGNLAGEPTGSDRKPRAAHCVRDKSGLSACTGDDETCICVCLSCEQPSPGPSPRAKSEPPQHAPTCASFDFDPEEQLGPDKACDCGADGMAADRKLAEEIGRRVEAIRGRFGLDRPNEDSSAPSLFGTVDLSPPRARLAEGDRVRHVTARWLVGCVVGVRQERLSLGAEEGEETYRIFAKWDTGESLDAPEGDFVHEDDVCGDSGPAFLGTPGHAADFGRLSCMLPPAHSGQRHKAFASDGRVRAEWEATTSEVAAERAADRVWIERLIGMVGTLTAERDDARAALAKALAAEQGERPVEIRHEDRLAARSAALALAARAQVDAGVSTGILEKFFATHRLASTTTLASRYCYTIGILSDVDKMRERVAEALDEYAKLGSSR
jgi:integrase